jgi:hypothetical protein
MIADEIGILIRKLTALAFCLNVVIDGRKHENVTTEDLIAHIEDHTIFSFLSEFPDIAGWGVGGLSDDDKHHLLGEWQSMANAIDAERKFGVTENGICLLLAYVLEGIQWRTHTNKLWPGPEPW